MLGSQDCRINSPVYRKLCNSLFNEPYNKETNRPRTYLGITENRDVDMMILEKLDDPELANVCSLNSHINSTCRDENFWMKRTMKKFGNILAFGAELQKAGARPEGRAPRYDNSEELNISPEILLRQNYIPEGTTWKEYYLWLSGMQQTNPEIVYQLSLLSGRADLRLILPPDFLRELPALVVRRGFLILQNVSDTMQEFLMGSDLGPSDPSDPDSIPLRDILDFTVLSHSELTKIMRIYAENNMEKTGKYLQVPERMLEYFAEDFREQGVDLDIFTYQSLMKLISKHLRRTDMVIAHPTRRYLDSVARYLTSIIEFYSKRNKKYTPEKVRKSRK